MQVLKSVRNSHKMLHLFHNKIIKSAHTRRNTMDNAPPSLSLNASQFWLMLMNAILAHYLLVPSEVKGMSLAR